MDQDEKRVTEYVATLPPFEPADKQGWRKFSTDRLALPPFLTEEGDHEMAFAERLGRHLQVAFADRLTRGEQITPDELRYAADAVDFQGGHLLTLNYKEFPTFTHQSYYLKCHC